MFSWASSSASSRTSSEICSAPASTIVMASAVPQTIRSSVESTMSGMVGLTTSSPSMRPTRTAPIGPKKGSGDSTRAADAPLMARMSCETTRSTDRIVPMTWTSLRKPLGNSGRIGRSTMRALSVGLLGRTRPRA